MKKAIFSLVLVTTLLCSQGCAVKMSERQATAITALVVIGAAIAILHNNSDGHYHKRDRHHGHGRHCGCRSCH